ncbi:MAG TPA: energy-coupling factor ABC transporter permease [Anaeromyxobacteraceae bacterium]
MHMADALLSPAVGLGFHAASAGLLATAARRVAREDGYERRLPLMGVLGAFVFAAQMVTFAIPGTGSSGHLAGGTLLAILVGPSAAFVVLASVLTVQALFFADGGLLALGCNLFNLGFWPAFAGIALHRRLARAIPGAPGVSLGALASAVVSLELGALGVVVQTHLSGRAEVPLRELTILMLGVHLPIGVVEGLVTAGVVRFVARLAPDRVDGAGARAQARLPLLAALGAAALFLGTVAASFASARPDGLAWSLSRALHGGPPAAHAAGVGGGLRALQERIAVLPEYAFRGVPRRDGVDPGTSAAGLVGALLVAGLILVPGLVAVLLRRGRAGSART